MHETLRRLIELAALDEKLAAVEKEECELPARREAAQGQLAALAQGLEQARGEIAQGELRQRTLEGELADLEAIRARLDQQQYEVTSRDAYQALLHEMESTREGISTRESKILELMECLEGQRGDLATLEAQTAEESARIDESLRAFATRGEELGKEIEALREERAARSRDIAPGVLERYSRIALHRQPAAVVIGGEICPKCRVGIPPQLSLQLLEGADLIACTSCHRILVHARVVGG